MSIYGNSRLFRLHRYKSQENVFRLYDMMQLYSTPAEEIISFWFCCKHMQSLKCHVYSLVYV